MSDDKEMTTKEVLRTAESILAEGQKEPDGPPVKKAEEDEGYWNNLPPPHARG